MSKIKKIKEVSIKEFIAPVAMSFREHLTGQTTARNLTYLNETSEQLAEKINELVRALNN